MPKKKSLEEIKLEYEYTDLLEHIFSVEAKIVSLQEDLVKIKEILTSRKTTAYEMASIAEMKKIAQLRTTVLESAVPHNANKLFTIKEAGKALNVSPRTILRWINASKISAVKFPGTRGEWRIKSEHLAAWLNKRSIKARSF